MRRKLPEKFKTTLRGLIAQGWAPRDAMKEAWRVYKGEKPGMTRRKLNPGKNVTGMTTKQLREFARKPNPMLWYPTEKRAEIALRELTKYHDIKKARIVKGVKNGIWGYKIYWTYSKKSRKNPLVVYNPEMRPRVQVSKKSHRGKLRPHSPLKGYRINPRSIVTGASVLPLKNVEIRYQRANGEYRGEWFRHPFKSSVEVLGLVDGSILIRSISGKKLWGEV
jgi:hypothetical protein